MIAVFSLGNVWGFAQEETDATKSGTQDVQAQENQEESAKSLKQLDSSVLDLTFDDIKFDMEVGQKFSKEMLTKEILELNGKTIRIRGFIRPSFSESGLTKFVFVRDNQACCFGPGAALYDCILVQLEDGLETSYTLRPITVKGTFYFKTYKGPDGEVWAIYRLKDAVVE